MKIIIDISENDYWVARNYPEALIGVYAQAIKNGSPLPKGHGRLIDADAFQEYCFNKNFDKRLSDEGLATINLFLGFQPTIIEAECEE